MRKQVLVVSLVALNGQTNWTMAFCVLMQLPYVLPHALKENVTMRCSSLNKEEDIIILSKLHNYLKVKNELSFSFQNCVIM